MRRRNPDQHYRNVVDAVRGRTPPTDPIELALYNMLAIQDGGVREEVKYAHEVYSTMYEREILQSWIIARATDEQINEALRIPVAVLQVYRATYFDLNIFRDELDLLSWVREYGDQKMGTPHGAAMLKQALAGGVQALAWMYGRGTLDIEPRKVMENIMADAYFRGKAARGNAITSREVALAHGFMKTAIGVANTLAKTRPAEGLHDLMIKLKHRDMTESIEAVAAHEEILH